MHMPTRRKYIHQQPSSAWNFSTYNHMLVTKKSAEIIQNSKPLVDTLRSPKHNSNHHSECPLAILL